MFRASLLLAFLSLGCSPACPPVADWSALDPAQAAGKLAETCSAAPAPLKAWLADEAAGKRSLAVPAELDASWKAACSSSPDGDVCGLPAEFVGTRGNPVLALVVHDWLVKEGTDAATASLVAHALRGAPRWPADAKLTLPDIPGEPTQDVAGVALASDGVHAGGALVTPNGPHALGDSPGGWSVAEWTKLDEGGGIAADADASASDLVRLVASVAAPGETVKVLGHVKDGVGSVGLTLPKEADPAALVVHLSGGGLDLWRGSEHVASGDAVAAAVGAGPVRIAAEGGTVRDLTRLLGALSLTTATLDLADSPCAAPLDGMVCVPGGPIATPRPMQVSTFYVDSAPVSSEAYAGCVKSGFCNAAAKGDTVSGISWQSANRYCTWAGKRLPTEWEWEKANQAGAIPATTSAWTRSWKEPETCGAACESPDAQGPCGGSEPCSSGTQRVQRGGETSSKADALWCALSGAEGQDPPPFFGQGLPVRSPALTRAPGVPNPPFADPGIPQPPTEQELALVRDLKFDAIEDKPVCPEEVVKSWNFASGVGGKSELDCRDPVAYVDTNEARLTTFVPYIQNIGGAYAGVGAAQNYDLIALAHSQWAFLFDYEPNVVRLHKVLRALILASDSPEAFVKRFDYGATKESVELIAKAWPDDPEVGTYQRTYLGYQGRLAAIYKRQLSPRPDDPRFGWLAHADQYTYIRTLYQQGRIVILPGDMLASKTMQEVGRATKALGIPMRIFYTSNAPTSWGGNITPEWRANVGALPFDDASLVLVTWNHGAFDQQDYWHYNVQRARMYQQRLQHPGYRAMWQLAWDRIPSGDPDLTLSGLAGG